ncbi:MAG TPA: hypothetical protein GXX28_00695 [Firmicutes bacterium]|nr:hypothetical protein [Bacillota bacterium]
MARDDAEKAGGLDRATVAAMERSLSLIPGVDAVRIITGEDGEIAEIHGTIAPGRGPKQVARDFETLLFARYGLRVDYRKISLAQVGDEPKPLKEPPRLAIHGVESRRQGNMVFVRVELANAEANHAGSAEGPASSGNRLRLAAQATLEAVKGFTGERHQYVLEEVRLERVGRREVVVVCVTLVGPRSEETLLGAAQAGRDELEATIRATMKALNRRLGRLMAQPKPA